MQGLWPEMRIPRLARHTGIYIAAPVFQRTIYFFLIPVFTRLLTPAEYGAWGYVTVVGMMVGSFAPLGLLSAYGYAVRRPQSWRGDPEQIRSASLQVSFLLVLATALIVYPICRRIDLGVAHADLLWAVVLGATVVGYFVQAAKRRFQMVEKPFGYAGTEITGGVVVSGVSFLGVAVWQWGVMGLAAGLAAGAVAVIVPAAWSMRHDLRRRFGRAALMEAFAFGLPLFVHTGAAVLLQYVDRFMLERMSTMYQLGLYSLAGQIGTAMLIITTAANQAYLPFLYRQFDDRPDLVRRAQAYVAGFFAVMGIAGALAVPLFIRYLVDPRYADSQLPAQLLLISGIFHGFYFLVVGRLMVKKRTVTIAVATLACAVLNIALNYYMIPRLQATGAAWATLLTEVVLFACLWYFARGIRPDAVPQDGL